MTSRHHLSPAEQTKAIAGMQLWHRGKTAEYTYDLKSDRGTIIAQFDVVFEYEIEDDGTDMPFVDVTAIYIEGNEDLLRDRGLSGKLGFDIRQAIHDDKQLCDDLIEAEGYEYTGKGPNDPDGSMRRAA